MFLETKQYFYAWLNVSLWPSNTTLFLEKKCHYKMEEQPTTITAINNPWDIYLKGDHKGYLKCNKLNVWILQMFSKCLRCQTQITLNFRVYWNQWPMFYNSSLTHERAKIEPTDSFCTLKKLHFWNLVFSFWSKWEVCMWSLSATANANSQQVTVCTFSFLIRQPVPFDSTSVSKYC